MFYGIFGIIQVSNEMYLTMVKSYAIYIQEKSFYTYQSWQKEEPKVVTKREWQTSSSQCFLFWKMIIKLSGSALHTQISLCAEKWVQEEGNFYDHHFSLKACQSWYPLPSAFFVVHQTLDLLTMWLCSWYQIRIFLGKTRQPPSLQHNFALHLIFNSSQWSLAKLCSLSFSAAPWPSTVFPRSRARFNKH